MPHNHGQGITPASASTWIWAAHPQSSRARGRANPGGTGRRAHRARGEHARSSPEAARWATPQLTTEPTEIRGRQWPCVVETCLEPVNAAGLLGLGSKPQTKMFRQEFDVRTSCRLPSVCARPIRPAVASAFNSAAWARHNLWVRTPYPPCFNTRGTGRAHARRIVPLPSRSAEAASFRRQRPLARSGSRSGSVSVADGVHDIAVRRAPRNQRTPHGSVVNR